MRVRAFSQFISISIVIVFGVIHSLHAQDDWYGNDHFDIETIENTTTVDMQKKPWESFSLGVSEFDVSGEGFAFNISCLQAISLRVDMVSTANQKSTLVEQEIPANELISIAYTPAGIDDVSHLIFYINPGVEFNGQVEISNMVFTDDPVLSVLLPSNGLKVYPVPTVNNINIELPTKDSQMVEIFNSQGLKVGEQMVFGGEVSLQVSNLATGMYYIRARNKQTILTSRFIVQ